MELIKGNTLLTRRAIRQCQSSTDREDCPKKRNIPEAEHLQLLGERFKGYRPCLGGRSSAELSQSFTSTPEGFFPVPSSFLVAGNDQESFLASLSPGLGHPSVALWAQKQREKCPQLCSGMKTSSCKLREPLPGEKKSDSNKFKTI